MRDVYVERVLFPAAAVWVMVAVPLWLAALRGWIAVPGPYWHAHEMLFGCTLAIVAGYLFGRMSRPTLALLAAVWLIARIAPFLTHEGSLYAVVPEILFSSTVTLIPAWRFARAAKKLQNRVFAPLLVAMLACDAVYEFGAVTGDAALQWKAVLIAVDLYTFLVLMMGGRIIPALVAGHYYRKGQTLAARVQPPLEIAAIALMAGMMLLDPLDAAGVVSGALAIGAAAVTAVRVARWRLWTVLDEPSLWSLGLGYAWLVPGLALKGWAQIGESGALTIALHALAIGAIGTVTLVMMARTRMQRSRRGVSPFRDIAFAAVLLGAATVLRLMTGVDHAEHATALLWAAAAAWVMAFGLLVRRLSLTPDLQLPHHDHGPRVDVT